MFITDNFLEIKSVDINSTQNMHKPNAAPEELVERWNHEIFSNESEIEFWRLTYNQMES